MVEHTMDVSSWLRKQLEEATPDLLRVMVKDFAEALMSADADAVCGAGYGERSSQRVNRRNGYRERDWDTRVGSIELAVPRLREGSYFPDPAVPWGVLGQGRCRGSNKRRHGVRRCQPGLCRAGRQPVLHAGGLRSRSAYQTSNRPRSDSKYPVSWASKPAISPPSRKTW